MSDLRLDHVAVAVHSIDPALRLFRDALGAEHHGDGPIDSGDERGRWRWFQMKLPGGGKIELLEPLGEGFLTKFLSKRGEGLHHITLKTDDIAASIEQVRSCGFELVDVNLDDPHWKEAFLRPSQAHGTLIQLAQSS
ncbi:MAG: methylmalonyl-CoA/ethylmalonyl-CoA epimerase [Actinomycetota bacterium]|nr:methylmalonyl-CoA/ethylmalonyl-CoA epimerase [Actinomycetota bacterium]